VAATLTVKIASGDFVVTISSDAKPYPDLLSEMTTRCRHLFIETQASLPDSGEEPP
jgi:hypothetical protein